MKRTSVTKTNQSQKRAPDCCHRCSGLRVPELSTDTGRVEWHCVTCGDRVDEVILTHRQHQGSRQESEEVFAGPGRARLN